MAKQNAFERFKGTPGYIASGPLVDAVNCAIALERPLLIKGEPGTGKTVLARHVAEGLGMPLINWHIKSTTKAIDGLYVYDTVQRLNDSRFGTGDVSDIGRYIKLGPIGQAFSAEKRQVLLIDEVDKADLEFPNDLLHELDEMRFNITETNEEIVAKERPVVIITSNNEKELPDAFLRRCIFHFIEFPDRNLMKQIVAVHHKNLDVKLLDQVLIKFYWLREQNELRKKPSTSELVDWISALLRSGISTDQLESHIPFLGALLKKEQDVDALASYDSRGGKYPAKWSDLGPRYNQ
jgi:MoxR-like ATPase